MLISPEKNGKIKPHQESESVIDTSQMNEGKRRALEMAEASRDNLELQQSLAGSLFMGKFPWKLMDPFPQQSQLDKEQGDQWLEKFQEYLESNVDPDAIDENGEIPDSVFKGLAELGAFSIKIDKEFDGLGLSQVNYSRAATILGSYCGNTTALISAHQSIGVPQPLIMFGTQEQKQRYLPRFAKGEVSAFALTETGVGSDPARMTTSAELSADGSHYILNGEKLWCTNGTKASVIVVMAKTPSKMIRGKERPQITAFICDMDTHGVEVVTRCHFMGLKALYNGVIRFTNVKIPRENVILGEGRGLKVALATLNTGRLTLPSACVGMAKKCLKVIREWATEREQWGAPIGHHAAVADKIATIAANTFAMESMTLYTSALVDQKQGDIRIEAAMCKMWGTEKAWDIINETIQIRGGRGYETAQSLKNRGERPIPVERFMRDSRINTLFEGSSEIMRLFIAREALDPHLKTGGAVMNSKLPMSKRFMAALGAAKFYATWYPKQWLPTLFGPSIKTDRRIAGHIKYAKRMSKKLARTLFHQMAKFGPKLEREQILLGHLVDIGTELFAITATCARGATMLEQGDSKEDLVELVDFFCRESRLRIEASMKSIHRNNNKKGYRLARNVLGGNLRWFEKGIIN